MDRATETALRKAAELLQAHSLQEASGVLARILSADPDNEVAWHMLSYALTDRGKQIVALQRVLHINPHNQQAQARLAQLGRGAVPMPAHVAPVPDPAPVPAAPPMPTPTPVPAARRGVAPVPTPAVVSFPGTMPQPEIAHSHWQHLKTRSSLTWRRFKADWSVFSQSRLAVLGLVIIAFFGLLAIAHPILIKTVWPRTIYDPATGFDMQVFPHPSRPGPGHLLGTDTLGRDVLSMLLAATTPTFIIGLTAALTTALVGTVLSVTAAYFRGAADAIITNLADVFLLFPAPVIMVIVGARFRDLNAVQLGMIYGLVTGAGPTTIVMRTHALQVVSKPYMEAAQIAGGGAFHIITKHMLPAMMPLAALQMMIAVTGAVVADGFISFFGLTRTTSNWGTLIYDAFVYGGIGGSGVSIWHMLIPAALCFSLFALGFYLVSRGLHRVASPTIREEQAA